MQLKAEQIPKKDWSRYLLQSVRDKARTAISYIDIETTDYDEIKRKMLAYFIKTPDYYRNKFNNAHLDNSNEPTAFVKDVEHYFITWLELMNDDVKDPKQIINMIVYDKILCMASDELFSYLKEKNIDSIDKIISAVTSFKDSHPNRALSKDSNTHKFNVLNNVNRNNNQSRQSFSRNNFRRHSYSTPNWHNNNYSSNYRHYNQQQQHRNRTIRRVYCGRLGHIARECFKKQNDTQPKVFEYQQQQRHSNRNSNRGRNDFNDRNNQQSNQNSNTNQQNKIRESFTSLQNFNGKLYLFPSFVNNVEVMLLQLLINM
jgi:SCAN domain